MNKQNYQIAILFTLLLIISNLNLCAQKGDITLSFFAQDAATNNTVALEKVYINNLSQDCDTTVFGAQPVLEISFANGIDELSLIDNFHIEQNYPNPFQNTTKFKLQLGNQQNIIAKLFNIQGTEIAHLETKLSQGTHAFDIEVNSTGLFNLEINNGQVSKSIKMISNSSTTDNSFAIAYAGTDNMHNSLKSTSKN
ncbi:MAG: T9SS type A sorting domain-containing protein, partial [Bacteroidales bacterium]|nr:T9SS type A sorting domain-containing protein [Bacteroidales bacterium]